MKVGNYIAILCGIVTLTVGGVIVTAPPAVAQPAPTPLDCRSDRKNDKDIEVRCWNLSAERSYRVRVSIDCAWQPDPSEIFDIPRKDDRRVTLSCNSLGNARGTFKYEVIQ
ncbi:hypothetical protein [Nocardia sp. NPDC047654]|uniref:hypothetical protein n=1 Tax=Nocardia sp. NPDC047654 TaxID=3364314 RepID=UPI003717A9D5